MGRWHWRGIVSVAQKQGRCRFDRRPVLVAKRSGPRDNAVPIFPVAAQINSLIAAIDWSEDYEGLLEAVQAGALW